MLSGVRVGRTLCSSRSTLKMHLPASLLATPEHEFTYFKGRGQDTYRRVFTFAAYKEPARTPQATELSPRAERLAVGAAPR